MFLYLGGAQSCRVQSNRVPTYVLFLQVTFTTSIPAEKHTQANHEHELLGTEVLSALCWDLWPSGSVKLNLSFEFLTEVSNLHYKPNDTENHSVLLPPEKKLHNLHSWH